MSDEDRTDDCKSLAEWPRRWDQKIRQAKTYEEARRLNLQFQMECNRTYSAPRLR